MQAASKGSVLALNHVLAVGLGLEICVVRQAQAGSTSATLLCDALSRCLTPITRSIRLAG